MPTRSSWCPGGSPADDARALRDTIERDTGLPVTVAIGRTRTLAKMLVELSKPFGYRAVTDPAEERAILADLPVTAVPGIGGRHGARLAEVG